jgi:hypothetical protein
MKTVCAVSMVILLICFGFSSVWAESKTEKKQVSAAEGWLYLIDDGKYTESWKEASIYFRGAVSEQNWVASLKAVRKPLGKLVNREIVKMEESSSLPGAPDGKYVVMTFKTVFEQKKSAIETVTFMLNKDEKWRAAGYFIK